MSRSALHGLTIAAAAVVAATGVPGQMAAARAEAADSAYINGKVVTVDEKFSTAQAFAVRGDRFVAVGSNETVRKLVGPGSAVIDLGGRTVTPGFIDTHPHVIVRGRLALASPSLVGLQSVAAITQRIAEAATKAPPGAWIVTTPMGEPPDYFNLPESLAEKRWPTRADLDRVAPKNPVYIPTPAWWPNPAILNSAALALMGITRSTPDEPRVRIRKDPDTGEPTGVIDGFIFYNATSPLFGKLRSLLPPPPPADAQLDSLRKILSNNLAAGVTGIYEAHGNSAPQEFNEQLRQLRAAGHPTGRAVGAYEIPRGKSVKDIEAWMAGLKDAAGAGTGDDYVKTVGVTASMDGGAAQFGMALFNKPYLDPLGQLNNGPPTNFSLEELTAIGRLAVKHNLRLNVMASGDKACAIAVEALEAVDRESPLRGRGWVLEHFQHPTRGQIQKIARMGLMVQTYASADYSKGAETYVKRFPGQDLWKTVVPLRWWLDEGVVVAGSSDGAHYNPIFQIWETIVRVDGRTGESLLTDAKKVSLREAVEIHTINGARLLQWEDRLGSIETGKLADFVVLDRDILTVPLEQLRGAKALLTVLGGEIVHDSGSLAGAQH